jgi:predicted permease
MKAFFKELLRRLALPTVYAPIIGFIIATLVASDVINIGEDNVAKITELIIEIVGGLLTALGVANNPTNKTEL